MDHFGLAFQYQIKKEKKKEWTKKCANQKYYHSAIWQHLLHIPPTKILIKYAKKTKNKRNTKESTFWKMEDQGKGSQENGPKAEKDKTETEKEQQDQAEEQKRRYIEK